MERLIKNPISTILGIIIMAFAGVLLFVETKYDITFEYLVIMFCAGFLIARAEDKFIDIITIGLPRLFSDVAKKAKSSSIGGGGTKDPDPNG